MCVDYPSGVRPDDGALIGEAASRLAFLHSECSRGLERTHENSIHCILLTCRFLPECDRHQHLEERVLNWFRQSRQGIRCSRRFIDFVRSQGRSHREFLLKPSADAVCRSDTAAPKVLVSAVRHRRSTAIILRRVPKQPFKIDPRPVAPLSVGKTARKYGVSDAAVREIRTFVAAYLHSPKKSAHVVRMRGTSTNRRFGTAATYNSFAVHPKSSGAVSFKTSETKHRRRKTRSSGKKKSAHK
jgi:hypothetical protein